MMKKNTTHFFTSLLRGALAMLLLALTSATTFSQSMVSGVVTDESNEPLIGAAVVLESKTGVGTITDVDGKYSLNAAIGDVLLVSYVGYNSQKVKVASLVQNVALSAQKALDEVVVVGYGKTKKSDLTGSVASVKPDELKRIATANIAQALQGRVAGVDVTGQSGEPGAGMRIRIRGVGTINNSDPLYVVDGFPVGNLSFLSPNDVERIEVLKDASATSIYGSRGANGVVLITTKHGKLGAPQFAVEAYRGVQLPPKSVPLTNASQYATLYLEALANDGLVLSDENDVKTRLEYIKKNNLTGTDWQKEIFRSQAMMQNYSLNITGGTESNRYLFSATAFTQDGIVKNSDLRKYFVRFNNDMKLSKWLNAGVGLNYVYTDKTFYNDDQYSGILPVALRIDPITPAWDSYRNNWGRADISYLSNPARAVDQLSGNKGYNQGLIGNVYVDATLLKGLTLRSQFNTNLGLGHNKSYSPQFFVSVDEARDLSSLWERRSQSVNWTWTNYLTYEKSFGRHNLTAMLGEEAFNNKYSDFQATGYNVPSSSDLQYLSSSKNTDFQVNSSQSEEAILSYFGRLNYSFANKYLLTATLRRDGSSRFLANNRWGTFPSFSVGWNIAQEGFLKKNGIFDEFKLRGGWGQVGNQNSASNYGYVTTVEGNQRYVFGGQSVQGFASSQLSNPELKWETTEMTNVGADFSVLKDRLSLTADYFIKKTNDMIVAVPIPIYVGTGAPRVNAGSMQNKGIELAVNWRDKINKDFKYDLGFNFTKITNQVVSLGGGAPINSGSINKVGDLTRTEIGREIAYYYGLKTDGIFHNADEVKNYKDTKGALIQPVAKPGDVRFVDLNGDGVIDANDRTYLGSATPDFTYAINGSIEFKGFDVRVFFQGTQGSEIVNSLYREWYGSDGSKSNYYIDRLNRWTADNPTSNEPRMTVNDANQNAKFSDRYVSDGSYLRLKNVTIGYTLPLSIGSKMRLKGVRVYVSADNVWTKTNYKGLDPEIGERFSNPLYYGIDMANYPQQKNYRVGVNVNF